MNETITFYFIYIIWFFLIFKFVLENEGVYIQKSLSHVFLGKEHFYTRSFFTRWQCKNQFTHPSNCCLINSLKNIDFRLLNTSKSLNSIYAIFLFHKSWFVGIQKCIVRKLKSFNVNFYLICVKIFFKNIYEGNLRDRLIQRKALNSVSLQ